MFLFLLMEIKRMSNFDNKQRKEFKIKDIFITDKKWKSYQVPTWASITTRNLIEWETPRITVTWLNNWIIWNFADMNDVNYRVFENFISVSFLWTIFYHNYKASLDMKVHCLKPKDFDLNNYTWKYLVSVLRKSIANSSYADQISSTVLPDMLLYLPVNSEWNPDREYMENYMKEIEEKCKKELELLKRCYETVKSKINTKSWKIFKIWDLFEIIRGKRFVIWKHIEWNIPYYSASLECNWITDYISNPIFIDRDALVVTTFWNAFYAEWEFTASDEITILHHKNLNKNNWLFIATIITANKRKYSFKIKAFCNRISNDYIKLPVDNDWNPDRNYMENYIKNIMEKNKEKLNCLN